METESGKTKSNRKLNANASTPIDFKEVGDHIVYYGQVTDGAKTVGNPLLYAKGGYQRLL